MTSNKKPVTNDVGFLSEYAGVGLEDMKGSAVSIPYLTMVQPGSQATLDGCPAVRPEINWHIILVVVLVCASPKKWPYS